MKRCKVCGEEKGIDEFPVDRSRPDGRHPYCRTCKAGGMRRWRDSHRDEIRRREQERYHASPVVKRKKLIADEARRIRSSPEAEAARRESWKRHQRKKVLAKFGITSEQYDQLAEEGCGICGSLEAPGKNGRLVLDHDHETGEFRGLLCGRCNLGIGQLGDDPERLLKAAEYLARRKNVVARG